MKQNFDVEMTERLRAFQRENARAPRILVHTCCTPCLSGCLDRLEDADLTFYFYNPNIETREEHDYRLEELYRYLNLTERDNWVLDTPYDHEVFLEAVKGLENEPERGARCEVCFRLRLMEAAKRCRDENYDFFTTTLTLSPLKYAPMINKIGQEAAEAYGVEYLVSDFKKRDGFKKSLEESKKYELYRQDFCGCEFSKR